MSPIRIRGIVFQDEKGLWCAQCLEYDIAAQAGTVEELRKEFSSLLSSYIQISADLNRRPFEGLPRAPRRFFKMYETATSPAQKEGPIRPPLAQKSAPSIVPELRFATA
jgi:hypothetical protein